MLFRSPRVICSALVLFSLGCGGGSPAANPKAPADAPAIKPKTPGGAPENQKKFNAD